ncbi:hypothetical protein L6164_004722 [Bauhinia variegata]|uniref:Uncharacterized protein n=1 Tax=Bauhinia variegata TaxID=167791 RepID=A0ACB9PNX6_BAUVA|nr:hypothetical protein L6164_004722 [Bauhinia variegata]
MGGQKNLSTSSTPQKRTLKSLFEQDKKIIPHSSPSSPTSANDEILTIIYYCSFEFTFNDPFESLSEQEFKRVQLTRLLTIIKCLKKPPHEKVLRTLVSMISINLFRPLPPPAKCFSTSDLGVEEYPFSAFSPMWSHLQIVYEILLRLVGTVDQRILKEYIDHIFLLKLLALFQSEDPRERESLKNVCHKIYAKFISERSFMRKSMKDVLLNYVFGTENHPGIAELLEIWGTIINGFTVPLKEEHKLFLMRVLIPLHKTMGMQMYHKQLAYCISQFVQKEPMLGGVIVRRILRYWPVTNSQKEVMLIGELEEMVENLDPDQCRKLALPLCTQITKCTNSLNSQVAERALFVWNNEQFVKMATTAMGEVFPIIVQGMEKNLKWHWSKSIRQITERVKMMLEEMDPVLYKKGMEDFKVKELEAHEEDIKRKRKWERIELAASQSHLCVSS